MPDIGFDVRINGKLCSFGHLNYDLHICEKAAQIPTNLICPQKEYINIRTVQTGYQAVVYVCLPAFEYAGGMAI